MAKTKKCPDCAESVLADARKCRFCGYEFSLHSVQKAKASDEATAGGCGLLLLIGFIIFVVTQCGSGNGSSDSNSNDTNVQAAAKPSEAYAARLKREVDSLRKNPRLTDIPTDKTGLLMAAVVIGARIKLYQEAPPKLTREDEKLRAEFRRLEAAYQRDAFPKLRRAQAKVMDELLWEHNVDAAAVGGRNETLRFTGGIFASNRGVKVAQEAIGDTVEILRFKRVMYEWYRGSEYQYYDFKPVPDGELAEFIGNRWVRIE